MKTTALLTTLLVGVACQIAPQISRAQDNNSAEIQSDYIGQTWFPLGDYIEITSVDRDQNEMTVKGHYNLVSRDTASLSLFITTSNGGPTPVDPQQEIKISKGSGDFELTHPHVVTGLPHVSMYGDGHPFASVYFGTADEAAKESKAEWITNSAPPSADSSGK